MGRASYLAKTQGGYRKSSSSSKRKSSQSTGSPHGDGNKVTSNKKKIDQNIKFKQEINKGTRTSSFDTQVGLPPPINRDNEKDDTGAAEAVKQFQVKTKHGTFANQAAANAYQASLKEQERMKEAIAFMESQKSNQSGQINLNNIDDKKLEEIAKTGLFAMEASGDLGGTFGAEIEANKLKYALANAQTNEEAAAIRATMEKMGYFNISQYDPFTSEGEPNPNYNPNLGYDPTGMLSFGDVESDPNLKFSYYGLQNKNASADQIRQFLPNVYGYKGSGLGGLGGGGGGYGGYGGGGGGSGGGQGGYIYDMDGGFPQTYQRGQVGPGSLQEQVNQAYLSGGKGFARGGIVSLLRL